MWAEVEQAGREERHELVLQGRELQAKLDQQAGLDPGIFQLAKLNFLQLSQAKITAVPETLGNLANLTSLVLKSNNLNSLPSSLSSLTKLKLLDLSLNSLTCLPSLTDLTELTTLNLSLNQLTGPLQLDGVAACSKLTVVDLSGNRLTSLTSLESAVLPHLAELAASQNKLQSLSGDIQSNWPGLRKLDLSSNSLTTVPAQLGSANKLKELSLVENPLADNRLRKMCQQKGTKSVLDYIKNHCQGKEEKGKGKKGKKGKERDREAEDADDAAVSELVTSLTVLGVSDEYPEICVSEAVREVRPYIVCCYVTGLDLAGEMLRKFLSLQTRLHKTVCGNRTLATIATHDRAQLAGPLLYTALPPTELSIVPLAGSGQPVTADRLVTQLRAEAEALRKEKKRSAVSGLHQYLPMLEPWQVYPCLLSGDITVSFPPVTNSSQTKIGEATSCLLVEVTSSTKLQHAKLALDSLLLEMTEMFSGLVVVQARVTNLDGELRVTYPSKVDLAGYQSKNITIVRQ